jgi:LacI family transcriptional regulator
MDEAEAARFADSGVPIIADFYRSPSRKLAQVLPDHEAIGRLAASVVRERGFVNCAFCGYDGILFSDRRRDGFVKALAQDGVDCILYEGGEKALAKFDENVILCEIITPDTPDARELSLWLASLPRPCGLFCCHDLRAFNVLTVARSIGLRVPEDLAILGVDNDVLVCNFTMPRLSSIDPNAAGVGRAAAKLLDDIIEGRAARDTVIKVPPLGVVTHASTETFTYSSPIVNEALLFIRRSLSQNPSSSDVFAHIGKSHTVVESAFRAELGTTVHAELQRLRMDEARRLLAMTNLPLADVARRSGFASARYFTLAFRKEFGTSPSAFREKVQS